MSVTVRIAGVARECDTLTGARITLGRRSVRESGQPSTAAVRVRVDESLDFVRPFDSIEIERSGIPRFVGTVAEVTLEHPVPGSREAWQSIAAVGPLASWGAAGIGDEPWPQETIAQRAERVAALIAEPLVVQGGESAEVVRLDVDDKRAIAVLDELSASVGGWLYDLGGTVYLQSLDARKVQTSAETWADEPLGQTWDQLDPALSWAAEDWNPYLPIDLDGCWVRWAPAWAASTEVATAVRLEYGRSPDWEARYEYRALAGAPASGELRMDNAGNATVSKVDLDGIDRTEALATVAPGVTLEFAGAEFTVVTAADAGAHIALTLAPPIRPADAGPTAVKFGYPSPVIEVEDADAIAQYGRREIRLTTQLVEQGDATELAELILARSSAPVFGFPSVTLDIARLPAQLAAEILASAPGARITLHDLPQPAPALAFHGVIEGWEETLDAQAHTLTLSLSDITHSLAVPTWDALPIDSLWSDEPEGEPWETELI